MSALCSAEHGPLTRGLSAQSCPWSVSLPHRSGKRPDPCNKVRKAINRHESKISPHKPGKGICGQPNNFQAIESVAIHHTSAPIVAPNNHEDHLEELKSARDRVSDDDSEKSWLGGVELSELAPEVAPKSQGVSGEELTALSS